MLPKDFRDPKKIEEAFFALAARMATGDLKALKEMHDFTLRISYEMTELSMFLPPKLFSLIWVVTQAIREAWYYLGDEEPLVPPAGMLLLDEFSKKLGEYALQKRRDMAGDDLLSRAIIILFKLFFLCNEEGKRGTENWLPLK